MAKLLRPFRHFSCDQRGTVVVEAVMALPILLWAWLGLFVFWDAFRTDNTLQKASYTVSDMISREMGGVDSSYVDGMDKVLKYLVAPGRAPRMRVTSVTWSATDQMFKVHWSRSPNNEMVPLTTATLQPLADHIPNMAGGDFAILVEVEEDYHPPIDMGLGDQVFHQFIVTRPRFVPCIPMDMTTCPIS